MRSDLDVVVVGAGPAGLSTAIEYLESGGKGRVTILEALRRPNTLDPTLPGAGHSQCSGGLGRGMLDIIEADDPDGSWRIPRSVIMADIRRAVVRSPNASVEVTGDTLGLPGGIIGVVTSRKRLDDWLLARAIRLGAHYLPGARVTDVSRCGCGDWDVFATLHHPETKSLGNGTKPQMVRLQAGFLVGADGPESLVAACALGAPPVGDRDLFLGSEVYVKAPSYPADAFEVYFTPETLSGYFWVFSAGDVVKVGCGTTRESTRIFTDLPNLTMLNGQIYGRNPSAETDWWRRKKAAETGDPGFVGAATEHVGGRITGAMPLKRVVDPARNVAVVGEAARAVWASVGAGDATAIQSGRSLGSALAHTKTAEYQRYWSRKMRPGLARHWRLKELLLGLSNAQMDRAVRLVGSYRPKAADLRREVPRVIRHVLLRDPLLFGRLTLAALGL